MKTSTFRKMTALVLSIMLVLSMCMTGVSVSAAESTKTIYFDVSNNWLADNARFAAYTWSNDVDGTFTSMTEVYDGFFSTKIPATNENIIFLRMDPATTENNWENKWNQTADITIPAGKNVFKINEGEWDGANGTWTEIPGPLPTTEPTTAPTTVPGPDALPPRIIYFVPNSNWCELQCRFVAYVWEDNNEGTFVSMVNDSNGIYKAYVQKKYTNIIFIAMNPDIAEYNWDYRWCQTVDLKIPDSDMSIFYTNQGMWDGATGRWQTPPPPTAPTYTTVVPTTEPTETTTEPTTAPPVNNDKTIHFAPSTGWAQDGARFAMYVWNNAGEYTFISMTRNSNNSYTANVPNKYTDVIFIRMDPSSAINDWDYKWNQTADLKLPLNKTSLFQLNENEWDGANGRWHALPDPIPTTTTTTTTATEPTEVTITPTTAPTTAVDSDRTIFFVPSSGWRDADARFSIYVWSDNNEYTFIPLKKYDDRRYSAIVPENYTSCIFLRMNPATTDDTWDNKWNQTVDITMPSDKASCFTLNENEWDGATGTWTTIPGPLPTTKPTTVTEPTETIVTLPTAPTTLSQQKRIFFNPSDNWKTENARFAMYMWGDSNEGSFVSMTKTTNDYYVAELADGCTNVIFVRMNPNSQDNNWNNKWNQTADLTVSNSYNLFTLNKNEWDNANGVWSQYDYNIGEFTKYNTIYFIPNKTWRENNARFAMYMWDEHYEGQFAPMTEVADGVYAAVLPPYLSNIIFVRMDPNTSENTWDNKWNQTTAVKYGHNANTCFVLYENEKEGATGVWTQFIGSTYPPTVTTAPTTAPTTVVNTDKTIYFIPSSNWCEADARFAAFVWNDAGESTFISLTKNYDTTYLAKVPEKYTDIIFVRMNPASIENTWENRWGQTVDLKIPDGSGSCFTVNKDEWDSATGKWSYYYLTPTTVPPIDSQPVTTEPTAPVNEVSIFGDIELTLEATDENISSGSIELQADTYKFNVNHNGTTLGFNGTYTDTATIDYSGGFKAQSTFKSTGGRYTFTFNANTQKLTIKHKSFEDIVELVGDINVELVRPKKTSTVFTGTIRLEAGAYSFKVNENGNLFGFNHTFEDVIYNNEFIWTAPAKFVATGGIYSVRYDTATNQLKIMHAPAGLGNTTVFGDISLPLANQGNGVYSAQTILDEGSYEIRIDSFGKIFGCGSPFTNTINAEFKTDWKAAATLKATSKMKFTFIFDTNTNKFKVFSAPIDTTKVKVAFDDIDALELTSVDGVTYTGKLTLTAGTYTFRMDAFGTPMGGKYTFTDNNSNMVYNETYASATTMTATGGTYTFSFNTKSNALQVTKG